MPSRLIVSKELAELLKLLAHPDRLRLIEELRLGEKDVTGIAAALDLPPTRISQHLASLRAHRLVEERREGRSHFYRLTQPAIAAWILEALEFLEIRSPLDDGAHIHRVRELWAADSSKS
ncbi:MAG: metalloregulator ArsR/SmtB family transcription factor [Erythrobacter sp.]|jgi:DNA-binding transcriptional ArsR family regulator|nr:metalloregulator ArsR/SmtB family transcription factor [Erythrobacter sp.]